MHNVDNQGKQLAKHGGPSPMVPSKKRRPTSDASDTLVDACFDPDFVEAPQGERRCRSLSGNLNGVTALTGLGVTSAPSNLGFYQSKGGATQAANEKKGKQIRP
jgi:hypothetical protein